MEEQTAKPEKTISEMGVKELRAYAKEHGITLGADVTTKDQISEIIVASEADVAEAEVETVKMVRDEPARPGGPVEADVAEAEVETWKKGGWKVEEQE